MQLDLFDSQAVANLRSEIDKVRRSSDSVRKGLFARNTAMEKSISDLEEKNERLERELYKLKQVVYAIQEKNQEHNFEISLVK